MARATRPKPPSTLKAPGKALWRSIHAGLADGFEFDERELAVLGLACRQVDDVAALEAEVKRAGVIVPGSKGQPRLSAIVTELRQARLAVARLLGELEMPAADDQPKSARSKRAQRAAEVRWAQVAARRGQRGA